MVTGAGGYIGTQLVRDLVKDGHEVTAVDRYFFGKEPLVEFNHNNKVNIIQKDIRDLSENDFAGHEAVCDLACLSNDPSGEIDPQLTYSINRDGRIHVAKTAKSAGVQKYHNYLKLQKQIRLVFTLNQLLKLNSKIYLLLITNFPLRHLEMQQFSDFPHE